MKKKLVIAIICSCLIGLTACKTQETQGEMVTEEVVALNENEDVETHAETSKRENGIEKSVSKELIDESRIMKEQSFDVELNSWGKVQFVSYLPQGNDTFEDVSFLLEKDGAIIYTFPYYCDNNNTEKYVGLFDSVAAVGFRDINNDNLQDIIIIINYVTGAGPQGMLPRPMTRIFLADEYGFYIETDLMEEIEENVSKNNLTIKMIYDYIDQ